MIQITSNLDLADNTAVKAAVEEEVGKLNRYLLKIGMQATNRMEAYMLREYIHAKLRGILDEEERGQAEP